MQTNLGISEVVDKHGVTADIEAKRFDGTRTVQIQGDVTASQTWNGDSSAPLTLNASIGEKKVTTDKINDKAVQAQQIDDGAVGLTQIATNAMNGTVQDNDSKLATHASVKTYVDSQISGQGTYLGKHTVAEINAMQTADLHNGDRVMTSDSGTINLGPGGVGFDVEAGEDLILYKSGSTVQWDSMDGNFKTKQTAVDDPTASGTGLTFIDSITQDENGEISATKKSVQDGTTSQKGVVQLEDSISSTSTTKAATPNSVKSAYDLANTANTGAVKNVAYDSTNKKITKTINGQTTDVVSAATLKTDMSLNNVDNTSDANKPVSTAQQSALDLKLDNTGDGKDVTVSFSEASTRANIGTGEKLSVMFGKIKKWFTDLKALAFKDTVADSDISGTISDNHIASAATWNGKADKVSGATNGNLAALDSNGNLTDSGKKASEFELVANKVTSWQGTPDSTHYPSEKLVKDGLDAKADAGNSVAISDAYAAGVVGKWYKVAETTVNNLNISVSAAFNISSDRYDSSGYFGKFMFSFRHDSSGKPKVRFVSIESSRGNSNILKVYVVTRGLVTGDVVYEIWVGSLMTDSASGLSISLVQSVIMNETDKSLWIFYKNAPKYNTEPQDDSSTNVYSYAASETTWVQSVKINNGTELKTGYGSVNIPLATTSADGAMSAADKTALEGKVTGPSSATADDIAVFDGTTGKLIKDSGKAFLPSTSTWDGTSDAKVPTAKAVQAKLDGKQDSLAFMNDSEAVAIWNDAKTAAANAS